MKEELSLAKFKMRIPHIKIFKVCTKTEVEILAIINEGLYSEYLKHSKSMKPKSFINDKMHSFNPAIYFIEHDLYDALKEYKRIKKHSKDELYLFDLLKK